jgi:type I restriction enzyme S subunit
MMGIEMLVPCDEMISAYNQQLSPILDRIEALQKQCDIAAEARDRLLPKLMNGEIEV